MTTAHSLSFGPFRLLPGRRTLLDGELPLRLGSRAFDILVLLAERAGELVSTTELMATVWPGSVVDAGSLRVHVAALRKALGDGRDGHRYIVNLPLQGYCFVAPVQRDVAPRSAAATEAAGPAVPAPAPSSAPAAAASLPALLTRLVGRDALVAELIRQLPLRRCLTLVGPGGIGKTTVALAVAAEVAAGYPQHACVVELAPLADEALVPTALASALGIVVPPTEPERGLAAYLRDKRMLVVLDNCEHLIGAVASLAETLLAHAPGVHLIATSREPLRIQGEWVQRVISLPAPPRAKTMSAREAQDYAATQLFVERARASLDSFELRDADVPAVAEICHRLDGIPLAIELAAASIEQLGVAGLAAQLGDCMALLTRGRRTALPRHQTLRATLDWSHALLPEAERTLLRRLAPFRSHFTLDDALQLGALPHGSEAVAGLVGKSLLVADISGEVVHYRLLELTRDYAAQKLAESGEAAAWARRHAEHLLAQLARAAAEREQQHPGPWLAHHARCIADLRAAAQWCFSPQGDTAIGITLAALAAPLCFALSLMAEFRQLAEQALAAVEADAQAGLPQAATEQRLREEMALREAHGHALWHTRGGGPAMSAAFSRALALAEQLQATDFQLRAVWGLWLLCNTGGDYAGSVRMAERFGEIAAPAPADTGTALAHDRMMALGLHLHGEQARARRHAQRVLEHPLTVNHAARNSGFQFDQRVASRAVLARISWLHGLPEQALLHARHAVDEALAIGHALSLCYAIANGAAPVAFWAGEMDTARRYTELLMARATEHSLYFWQAFGEGYRLLLALHDQPEARPPDPLAGLTNPSVNTLLLETLCTIDAGVIDERMRARMRSDQGGWCAPELLRLQAVERLAQGGPAAAAEARQLLLQGLALARAQQAAAWELRCTMSLARLGQQQGRPAEARVDLAAVLGRFEEGQATRDLVEAAALLRSLG